MSELEQTRESLRALNVVHLQNVREIARCKAEIAELKTANERMGELIDALEVLRIQTQKQTGARIAELLAEIDQIRAGGSGQPP